MMPGYLPPEGAERGQGQHICVRLIFPAIIDNSNGQKASVKEVSLFGKRQPDLFQSMCMRRKVAQVSLLRPWLFIG